MNELLRRLLFLPPQASTMAAEVDGLHYFVILTTMAGAAAIFLIGGYFLIRYRRGSSAPHGHKGIPASLEAGIITMLFALFVFMFWIGFRQFMKLRVAPENAMPVYVTGKQWMWHFTYPEGGGSIGNLYVPVGRPVKLIMTSRDVIHSFFVPDFRVKMDVVPGRYTTLWFEAKQPGRYDIFCTEYCGVGHSTMRGEVIVLSAGDYERWLDAGGDVVSGAPSAQSYVTPNVVGGYGGASQPLSLVERGVDASAKNGCLRCHSLDGTPHIGPSWKGLFGTSVPLKGGGTVVVDEAYITESMMDPLAKIHLGYQELMPSFQGLIEPAETAAIIELIRSLAEPSTPAPARAQNIAGAVALAPPKAPGPETLVERGKAIASVRLCMTCHSTDGRRLVGPSWLGLWGSTVPLQGGGTAVVDETYVRESLIEPTAKVHEGYPPAMPSYKDQLSAEEIRAVIAYIESLGGNKP